MDLKIKNYKNNIKILKSKNKNISDNFEKANENVRKYKSYYFKFIRSIQEKNKIKK